MFSSLHESRIFATIEIWKSYLNVRASLLAYPRVFRHVFNYEKHPHYERNEWTFYNESYTFRPSLHNVIGHETLQKRYKILPILLLEKFALIFIYSQYSSYIIPSVAAMLSIPNQSQLFQESYIKGIQL